MKQNKKKYEMKQSKNRNKIVTSQIVECRTTVMSFGIPLIALLTELMPFWYWTIYFLAGRTSGHPVLAAKL